MKELLRRLARRSAGHDVPRDHGLLPRRPLRQELQSGNALGLNLEKRFVAGKPDIEASLGGRAPQPSPLTASHQDDADLVVGHQLQTLIIPTFDILWVGIED